MAAYAVRALVLLGSDAALTTIVAPAIRYRSENKNIGKAVVEGFAEAAKRLGITRDELGDRVVPWLGFELDTPRVIDDGGRRIEASIGPDFKLTFRDLAKSRAARPRRRPPRKNPEPSRRTGNLRR
jgi:hypothetical protein